MKKISSISGIGMNINDLLKNPKSIYLTGATKVTSYRVFSNRSITQITNAVF